MHDHDELLAHIIDDVGESILATIIDIEGSAYRHVGTMMLFKENGEQIGHISTGCLEEDLAYKAQELLYSNVLDFDVIRYDTSSVDDLSWGRGAGCNGIIHVMIENVTSILRAEFKRVRHYLALGQSVISIFPLNKTASLGGPMFLASDGRTFGKQYPLTKQFLNRVFLKKKSYMTYSPDIEANIFVHHFFPRPRLFIFGAGMDVRPLAQLAYEANFSIHIWGFRGAYCNKFYFPSARLYNHYNFKDMVAEVSFTKNDFIIIMTHDFNRDKEILSYFLNQKNTGYLGIIGPRKRTSRLLGNKEIPSYLHSPVGLDIHAEGPREIAISICAELIEEYHHLNRGV